MFYVTTPSITVSSNKTQNGDILVPANPGSSGIKKEDYIKCEKDSYLIGNNLVSSEVCGEFNRTKLVSNRF